MTFAIDVCRSFIPAMSRVSRPMAMVAIAMIVESSLSLAFVHAHPMRPSHPTWRIVDGDGVKGECVFHGRRAGFPEVASEDEDKTVVSLSCSLHMSYEGF